MSNETSKPSFNPDKIPQIDEVKAMTEDLIIWIRENVPENRCRSIALTNYEQAVMWAVKAITI